MGVTPEPGVVREVCNEVSQVDGNERPCDGESAEAPLLVHRLEALKESEDEGVRETRKKRQTQHDGLSDQHDPRAHPNGAELLEGDARLLQLVGAVDVRVLAGLTSALGLLVEDDSGTGFRHEEVDCLGAAVENKLDPEVPTPVEDCVGVSKDCQRISLRAIHTSLNGTTNDTTNTCANARRQDDEGERELLVLRLVEIGDQAECNTAASGRKTTLIRKLVID